MIIKPSHYRGGFIVGKNKKGYCYFGKDTIK